MIEQAKALAARTEVVNESDPAKRVRALYRIVLARDPDADELRLATTFLAAAEKSTEKSQLTPWQQFAQVLLLTNEALFVE